MCQDQSAVPTLTPATVRTPGDICPCVCTAAPGTEGSDGNRRDTEATKRQPTGQAVRATRAQSRRPTPRSGLRRRRVGGGSGGGVVARRARPHVHGAPEVPLEPAHGLLVPD